MRASALLPVAALLCSCQAPLAAPQTVAVLVWDSTNGRYVAKKATLTTITDLAAMEGKVAKLRGGASIVDDDQDPARKDALSVADLQRLLLKDEGSPATANFSGTNGGTLYPMDFHSWNMATTYYNLEKAFKFFSSLGLTQKTIGQLRVFYFPSFIQRKNGTTIEGKDNAFYMPLLGSFLVMPFDKMQQVPFSMNFGIMAHEYTHAVFHRLVFDGAPVPDPYTQWAEGGGATPGLNLLESLGEGLADLMAVGATCGPEYKTCNTTFLGKSIDGIMPKEVEKRDLSQLHCIDDSLLSAMANDDLDTFSAPDKAYPYRTGTVLASALWRVATDPTLTRVMSQKATGEAVMKAVYQAFATGDPKKNPGLRELVMNAGAKQDRFNLFHDAATNTPGVLEVIVNQLSDSRLRSLLCSVLMDRFRVTSLNEQLKACPTTTVPLRECAL